MRVGVQRHALATLPPPPVKSPGPHCIGGWMSHSSWMDGCGKEKIFLLPLVFAPRKILPKLTMLCQSPVLLLLIIQWVLEFYSLG